MTEVAKEDGCCRVNKRLLPIKAHFFFFYGAVGAVIPYMPILAKGLGIGATAVGLVYTVLPFCIFLSKPIFGYLTDFFRNIKVIVFILVVVTAFSYSLVLLVPPIESAEGNHTVLDAKCQDGKIRFSIRCSDNISSEPLQCTFRAENCEKNDTLIIEGIVLKESNFEGNSSSSDDLRQLILTPSDNTSNCYCIGKDPQIECDDSVCDSDSAATSVFVTYQFWGFTVVAMVAGTCAATVFCLSDAACYEVLGDKPDHYGRQRMWATISWGAASFLAGFLNDLATGEAVRKSYAPGFYLMMILCVIDLVLLLRIRLTKANFSVTICKDVGSIFTSCETVVFAVAVYISGGLTGLLWNYQFWYLQDLGATQTLLGLTIAVQCLAAEVPFFFFAGWFIKKFGYFFCLSAVFAAFAIRCILYHFLYNPWLVLPIEVLHGITFAIFYASMTGYASDCAPPGTEATMMGILGGLFEGLGVASGSLLGGVGFDRLGGRDTFLVAAVVSAVCVPTILISYWIVRKLFPTHAPTPVNTSS